MSSYQTIPDDNEIERTRRQIQTLIGEVSQLSRQNLTPGQFYEQFLNRVVSALAANGGVVWTAGDNGQLALQYQVNLQQTGLIEDEEKQKSHSRLLYKLLANPNVAGGSGELVPPHSGFGDDEAANPTEFLLVFGPLRTDLEMVGLIEIFQRPNRRRRSSKATCASWCKCASWPAISSRAISCGTSPIARSCGPAWKTSPATSTARWSPFRPPTRLPTKPVGSSSATA